MSEETNLLSVNKVTSNKNLNGRRQQGTINLIKNVMRHKVNIVRESVEDISFSDDDEENSGANKLRKML